MKRICAIILMFCKLHAQFDTLSDFVSYAQDKPEYPAIDNDDWQHPNFSSFYATQHPSIWSNLLSYVGIKSPFWMPEDLTDLLTEVTRSRESHGMQGNFVQKVMVEPDDKVVLFGDIRGAFHSFVRDMQELVRLGIMDEDLNIINGNYLVLNGNGIGSSAYNVETMFLILTLLKKNPERFIYIRGESELVDEQSKVELFKQTRERVDSRRHTLFKQFATFFGTLPLALYVMQYPDDGLKIASLKNKVDQARLNRFLSPEFQMSIIHIDQLTDAKESDSPIIINAVVKSTDFSRNLGLKRYIGPPVTWSVMSSPTGVNRRLHAFFYDAFAIIQTATRFRNWTITLHYQDVRTKDGFRVSGTYNLTTGSLVSGEPLSFFDTDDLKQIEQRIAQKKETLKDLSTKCKEQEGQEKELALDKKAGETKKLVLGSSLDLSKSMKEWGKKVKDTLSQIFALENEKSEEGGIEYQQIFLDDGYTPDKARENYKKFVDEFNAEIMLIPLGTPTTQTSLDYAKSGKLVVLFPSTESSVFRKKDLKNIINVTRSYFDQGKALIDYIFKKDKDLEKIALFYQDDAFGRDGLEGAKEALKKYNVSKIIELPYERNQKGYAEQRGIIEKEQPDVIGIFAVPSAAQELLKGLPSNFLSDRILFGISDLGEAELQDYFKNRGLEVIHSSAFPDIKHSDLPLIKEFRAFAQRHNLTIGPFAFEAYIGAKLFLHLINNIKGPITKEKIIEEAEALKKVDFGGFMLNFDPETRTLLDALWISRGDGSPWLKIPVEVSKVEVTKKETIQASHPETQATQGLVAERDVQPSIAVQGDKIILGNTGDYSKGLKAFSESLKAGIQLKLNEINRRGGIHNRSLQIVYLDDGYNTEQARKNVRKLLTEIKTDLMFITLGTPVFQAYVDLVKNGEILALFPYTGSSRFRKKSLTNVIFYRPSYARVLTEVTKFIVDTYKATKFVLFYQQGSVGDIPVQAIKKMLRDDYNINDVLAVPFAANDMNFSVQAEQIKQFNGDAIAFIGPPVSAQGLIRQIGVEALSDKKLYGLSALEEKSFLNFARDKGLRFILPNVLPDAKNSEIELATTFRKLAKANDIEIDQAAFEAYVYMDLTAYLLQQVEGVLTKEKIIQIAQDIKDLDFQGLLLSFNSNTRILAQHIWINTGEDQPWIKKKIDSIAGHIDEKVDQEDKKKTVKVIDHPLAEKPVSFLKSSDMALQENVLIIGNSSDFSKGLKELCTAIKLGMNLKIDEINRRGGIKGNEIKIIYLDDGYDPQTAVKNIHLFLRDFKTDIILGSMGTPTLEAYLNLVENGTITDLFPYSGAAAYRKPELRHIIHYRLSYNQEVAELTKYIIERFTPKKVALFYQDDSYGIPIKNVARNIFKEHGITNIIEVPFVRNDLNFKEQAQKIKDFDPDAIGLMGTAISAQGLIRQMGVEQLTNKHMFGPSPLASAKVQKFLHAKGLKLIMSNIVPNPETSTVQLAKEFRENAQKESVVVDVNSFEGYLNASLLGYLLEKIDGKVTTEKLIKAAEEIKDVDFKGIQLNFNPSTRTLAKYIWINIGEGIPWIKKEIAMSEPTKKEAYLRADKEKSQEAGEIEKKEGSFQKIEEPPREQGLITKQKLASSSRADHGDTIVIGNTSDFSKGLKSMSDSLKLGINLKLQEVNASGGVNGKKIRMAYLDDGYIPKKARQNVETFLQDVNTDVLMAVVGTPTQEAYIDLVKDGTITALFPFTGSSTFRKPDLVHMIHYRPSYDQNIAEITK